jgi:uncharacterized membrane protein
VTTFSVAVNINAPPQRVLAVLCDVERWPEWTSTMTHVERLDRGPFAVGSSARVLQPKLRPAVWQVTELDENRSFTWVARAPGVRMTAGHFVEAEGGGSRAALSFEISGLLGPIISRLYRGLIRQYVATEAQGLKRRSETACP